MSRTLSAGILLYRRRNGHLEVFLVHPGGPFWAKKDEGAWSMPKGEYADDEDSWIAARREFHEETGLEIERAGSPLTPVKQPGGKVIVAWAVEGDVDATAVRSNTFWLEWPPKSGRQQQFPEVDRAGWFDLPRARIKLLPGQRGFVDQLEQLVSNERLLERFHPHEP